eukprot:7120254-Heterocapsa_arctica.AAC.1
MKMPKGKDFLPAHLLAAGGDDDDRPRSATPFAQAASSGQQRPADPVPDEAAERTGATPGRDATGHFCATPGCNLALRPVPGVLDNFFLHHCCN